MIAGLQPTPVSLLQPLSSNPIPQPQQAKPALKLGSTWADTGVNIDVDNLLGPRSPRAAPPLSINQLKSNPASPAHKINPGLANQVPGATFPVPANQISGFPAAPANGMAGPLFPANGSATTSPAFAAFASFPNSDSLLQ